MTTKAKYFGALALLLLTNCCFATIYKWTDENGKLHFTDSPPQKGESEALDEAELASQISSFTNVSVKIEAIDFGENQQSNMLIMYTTTRCGYCAKARSFFNQNGIDFQEKNIQLSDKYRLEFDRLGGRGVPVLLKGRVRMNGFSVKNYLATFSE